MIDVSVEKLIHFSDAPKAFPKPPCLQTLHRWRLRGVRGVKLETCLIGGLRFTSAQAISRFFAAQNPGDQPPSTANRANHADAARVELEKLGV